MFPKNPKEATFYSVALFLIVVGAAILAYGLIEWLFNAIRDFKFFMPSAKIIGGLIILALGYIQLEIELLRRE